MELFIAELVPCTMQLPAHNTCIRAYFRIICRRPRVFVGTRVRAGTYVLCLCPYVGILFTVYTSVLVFYGNKLKFN